jgi:hypothetical protein
MKNIFAIIGMFSAICSTALSQTGLTALMVNSNAVIAKPTNFITANNIAVKELCTFYQTQFVTFANLQTDDVGSTTEFISNSVASVNIVGTNTVTNAKSAVRLINSVNARAPAGGGTSWLKADHTFWLRIDNAIGTNAFIRSVMGNSSIISTNVASLPTNDAIGFELGRTNTNASGSLRIRLIAHNGTSLTNGPWVDTGGNLFQTHTIGIAQKTNGQVKLYISVDDFAKPQEATNAAITGGPNNNGAVYHGAWDCGIFQDGTNAFNAGSSIYTAWVSWTNPN